MDKGTELIVFPLRRQEARQYQVGSVLKELQ